MIVAVDPGLLDELKMILRRDLKLGPDARIADDMPLIGGDLDLDSLDILLVVSSVEKHFKIKIPNEVVGRWVFQNVATLAKFVQDNLAANQVGTAAIGANAHEGIDWLSRLPHGAEFRFISKVYDVTPGEHANGVWNLDGSEPFFKAHFPGRPLVPGVLMIEALAQIAGLAAIGNAADALGARGGMLAHADVKFESPVTPPASIELRATVSRAMDQLRMCDVIASVAGQPVARGSMTIRLV